MPKISIIAPVYNVQDYLSCCIESIISQTNDNWELILVDDCSTDNSGIICDEYALKDNRIKVIHFDENRGTLNARNKGIENASGDYIGFVDSDDFVDKDYIKVLLENLDNSKIDMLAFSYSLDFKNKSIIVGNTGEKTTYSKEQAIKMIHYRVNPITGMLCNKVFSRDAITRLIISKETVVGEDHAMCLNALFNCEKVVYLDLPLYHYRQRGSSVCNIGFTDKRWDCIDNYYKIKQRVVSSYPDFENEMITFCIVQELALIMAMGSSKYYDGSVAKRVVADVKKNISKIFKAKNSDLAIKACTILSLISPKILYFVGALRKKIKKDYLY